MKTNLKGNSGVTLVTLGIVVVILMILAGMTINNVSAAVNSARLNAFTTELKIMQSQVNSLNEKMRNNEEITVDGNVYKGEDIEQLGQTIEGNIQDKANEAFEALEVSEDKRNEYKFYDSNLIKNGLEVEGVGQDLLVNVKDREVISYNGLMHEGSKYYNLASLPDGTYNVAHEENNEKPQFSVASKQISSDGEWEFEVSDVNYQGYIDKWEVMYKHESSNNWSTSSDLKFKVNKSGTYTIKIVNKNVESEEVQCAAEYQVMPAVLQGMQAITFDDEGNAQNVENTDNNDWFEYKAAEEVATINEDEENTGNGRWANATLNENYYVWLPRYAYKVEDETITDENGNEENKINAIFIETSITADNVEKELGEGYVVPEAFTIDGKEVSGLWIGKYETSGTTEQPRIVENAEKLKNLDDEQMSEAARALDTENILVYVVGDAQKEAINYLTRSQYGRNGKPIPTENSEPSTIEFNDEVGGIDEITINGEEQEEKTEEIPEESKTSTGNKYGIYNIADSDGVRMYLRNK